jgi:GNAT superfamily N-acetyltransferase
MLLEAHVIAWLRDGLERAVDERDLDVTYAFAHPLNERRALKRQSIERPPRPTSESALWHVEFYEGAGRPVLEGPLARRLWCAAPLWSTPGSRGAVALNARFVVRDEFRRRGFAQAVYASERELYSRWGVREIQLTATDQGPVVWVKSFGFLPQDPELLAEQYRGWAARTGRPAEVPDDPKDYPAPFLSGCYGLMLYKVLA